MTDGKIDTKLKWVEVEVICSYKGKKLFTVAKRPRKKDIRYN